MSDVDVEAVLAGLKGFQRRAVNHVIRRFHDDADRARRYLVADETGLGKSVVARGVIAQTIERLRDDDDIGRIDIVYICSNADLAAQNLQRLNVTGDRHLAMATRLTMLAKETRHLNEPSRDGGKKVNLVSFTPGTSFQDSGRRQGSAQERAMLVLLLDARLNRSDAERWTTRMMFRGGMIRTTHRFDTGYVAPLASELRDGVDERIADEFAKLMDADGATARFLGLRDALLDSDEIPSDRWHQVQDLIGRLRHLLAQAGVEALEPDLVILDEFQRFKQLLDPQNGEAAALANALFDHEDARVLLLSATPYKPFTNAGDSEDDHYADFLSTIRFLASGDESRVRAVSDALSAYRTALISGGDARSAADHVSGLLVPMMSRSERPPLAQNDDLVQVRRLAVDVPSVDDLREWTALQGVAKTVDSRIDVEYWKSIPYFSNFMDGYKVGQRVGERLADGDVAVASALSSVRSLEASAIESFAALDLGNGPLRALARETVNAGWWKLLWMPPTMPYVEPGPIYAPFADGSVTKQVLFSAWSGAPGTIAALLSHEADRLAAAEGSVLAENTPAARASVARRLQYSMEGDRPRGMSALAVFWPHPGLAEFGDPLAVARRLGRRPDATTLLGAVTESLPRGETADQLWQAVFGAAGALPDALAGAAPAHLDPSDDERRAGLRAHIAAAQAAMDAPMSHPELATIAAFGPGNAALRAVTSIAGPDATDTGIWRAAFELADALRNLFNRPETSALLATLYGTDRAYWQSVVDYCADGNLQAVLDEYLFQLHSERGGADLDDDALADVARRAADAMGLRRTRLLAHANDAERSQIPMRLGFAVRYGDGLSATGDDGKSEVRQGEVRAAFNSPFPPFVLTSTSVGQEGIDFHWWSHAIVHWNLPSNPVDFEQREGRVNRFGGHAVRKNVAERHWDDVLHGSGAAWPASFAAASAVETGLGEFSPWWVYPGTARVHRTLVQYPLSRDIEKYEQLRTSMTLYRLTLGQPRQEDMVEVLAKRGVDGAAVPVIDLAPPVEISEDAEWWAAQEGRSV